MLTPARLMLLRGGGCLTSRLSSTVTSRVSPVATLNFGQGARALSNTVKMTWICGEETSVVDAPIGKTLLEVAKENGIKLDGTCGGELACSTCHVILTQDSFKKLPPKTDDEEEVLQMAWGLAPTSRLACQVQVTPELDGITLHIPSDDPDTPIEPLARSFVLFSFAEWVPTETRNKIVKEWLEVKRKWDEWMGPWER